MSKTVTVFKTKRDASGKVISRRPWTRSNTNKRISKPYSKAPSMSFGVLKQNPSPFPARKKVKMTYSSFWAASAVASGTPAAYSVAANSCFDPDVTGIGHQVRGHDEMAAIYLYYRVTAVRLTIIFTCQDTGTAPNTTRPENFLIGVQTVAPGGTAVSTNNGLKENQSCWWADVGTDKPTKVSKKFSVAQVGNVDPLAVRTQDGYAAGTGLSPATKPTIHMFVGSSDSSTPTTANITYTLTYDTVYYGRKPLAQS